MSKVDASLLRTRVQRTSVLSARISAAATALTGKAVLSSWLPMAVMMVAISSGSAPMLSSRRKAMIAPDWAWSMRLTTLPMSCR